MCIIKKIIRMIKRFLEYMTAKKDWYVIDYDLSDINEPILICYEPKVTNKTEFQINRMVTLFNQHRGRFINIYGNYCIYMDARYLVTDE